MCVFAPALLLCHRTQFRGHSSIRFRVLTWFFALSFLADSVAQGEGSASLRIIPTEESFRAEWDASASSYELRLEQSSDLDDWQTVAKIDRQDQVIGGVDFGESISEVFYRIVEDRSGYRLVRSISKSSVLFTQVPDATELGVQEFGATGVFWGHMPSRELHVEAIMDGWVDRVGGLRDLGLDYIGRGEFDWGWAWFIDFEAEPEDHWVRDLAGEFVRYEFMGVLSYKGQRNNWVSHHSPRFLDFMKFQVDKLFEGPVTHVMFDSQTSGTRSVHMFGGDFSPYAMSGFREYMRDRYSVQELADLGITDIDEFNYADFLTNGGMSRSTYEQRMRRISGNIPLYEDFVYFNRKVLNEVMDKVFAYVEAKSPGIPIGSTTSLIEPRGFLFSERMTYLAGELFQQASSVVDGTPLRPILHYKAAEALNKDLVFFPYPGEWARLVERGTPRQARLWIAQAYAMGAVFTIPKNVWVGGTLEVWQAPSELYSDLYQMIGANRVLFDGYRPYSKVGYVYPMLAGMETWGIDGSGAAHQSIEYLIEENISFDMLVFGDRDSDLAPTAERLEELDVVFMDGDSGQLTDAQLAYLDTVSEKLVQYSNRGTVSNLLSGKISVSVGGVERNDLISALPRKHSDTSAPYVIHLVNRVFVPSQDHSQEHEDVVLEISNSYFPETISGARLHVPGEASRDLPVTADGDSVFIEIGSFEDWNLVELSH